MSVSLKLLLSDYERARSIGDSSRAKAIFKEMEKIGLPDHLKPKPDKRRNKASARKLPAQSPPTGIKVDPGRF